MKENSVMKMYLFANKMYRNNVRLIPQIMQLLMRLIYSCDIPYTADIDSSTKFGHNALGVVIHQKARIGGGCLVMQNVTIGGNLGKKREYNGETITSPIIGNNIFIGPNVSILGPVIIGDNAKIGAGSVVLNDVKANTIVAGVPAKQIGVEK